MTNQRPDLSTIQDAETFLSWYWLKAEMMALCRRFNLPTHGSKAQLQERIRRHLNGEPPLPHRKRATSGFNWARETLTLETVITEDVSFGTNMRQFMRHHVGARFHFSVPFMTLVSHRLALLIY